VCDLETSRMGAPYIYDISHLRVNVHVNGFLCLCVCVCVCVCVVCNTESQRL